MSDMPHVSRRRFCAAAASIAAGNYGTTDTTGAAEITAVGTVVV